MASEIKTRAGVCAELWHNGISYLIPLNGEDRDKFEVVLDEDFRPLTWDNLDRVRGRCGFGLVGGGVKEGESLALAMWREWVAELGVLVGSQEKISALFCNLMFTNQTPESVPGLLVMQARVGEGGGWVFRNLFRVWRFSVDLTAEQFTSLETHLTPANSLEPQQMRPYVACLLQGE